MVTQSNDELGERQLLGVGEDAAHVADHAGIEQPVATFAQHRAVDVRQDHHAGLAHLLRKAGSKVAGAARDVERALAGPQARQRQREFLPETMRAPGHQVVHQVVVARNRIEHAAHTALLFVPRNAFVAEISVGVLLGLGHRAASIDGVFNETRNHWLFGRAFATKPNYSSGGLGKGRIA